MAQKKTLKAEASAFRASFVPSSINEDARTVELVWTTGAKVRRRSWTGDFHEELSLKKEHVRLERLNSGAPLLNNHGTSDFGGLRSLQDVIGVVESAQIRKGEGVAVVRFSTREDVEPIWRDVKDGILRNISVGYAVHKFEDVTKKNDEVPTYRAVDWEPMELSIVGIPADHKSQIRSDKNIQTFEAEIISGENTMKEENTRSEEVTEAAPVEGAPAQVEQKPVEAAPVVEEAPAQVEDKPAEAAPAVDVEAQRQAARIEERNRIAEIRKAVRLANLPEEFSARAIEQGTSLEDVRKEIFSEMEKRSNQKNTFTPKVEVSMENRELRSQAIARGMLNRFDPSKHKIEKGEEQYRFSSLIDAARGYLMGEGVSGVLNMSKREIAKRALHHSSDFPLILADVANKSLREAYEGAPATFSPFTAETSASDFKDIKKLMLSDGGKLEKVLEHGEYKRGTLKESKEAYKVEKYGKVIGGTLELMVNDDLGAFTAIPAKLGKRAREKESEIIWGLITGNQVMTEDGLAMFHATHANLAGAGAAISITTLAAAQAAMRVQKDLDGELINLNPRYLVVPAALEVVAKQFVTQITPALAGSVNPFANNLSVIVEPRLDANSATAWYAMADKAQSDMVELARLDGMGPEIFTREGFDVDGMEVKIRYIFGARVIDYRPFYKNPGA